MLHTRTNSGRQEVRSPRRGFVILAVLVIVVIMALLAWHHGAVPRTLGLDDPDPACELDHVVGASRPLRPRISLSTSAGFGGCNAALVLEGGA